MPTWDRRTPDAQAKLRNARLRHQLRDGVAPFSPFWRDRLAALRLPSASIASATDLARIPAVGERDVCPDGDPAGAARLVLRADEQGFALHAGGPDLRKALVRRVFGASSYQRQVEAEIRPTTYHFAGRAFGYPIASTRGDLDLVARAGNRAFQVLGLTGADVVVSAVPTAERLEHVFLSYAALAAGTPALFPGEDPIAVAETLRLVEATVLAVRPAEAVGLLTDLAALGSDVSRLTTLLLVGHPTPEQRADAAEALASSGNDGAAVLALYGPDAGRVMWAECREGATRGGAPGYHTYPDLDLVELIDPETGEVAASGGELVVTQLGFRGSALLRWRTGDLVTGPLATAACPACGRTVPRVPAELTVAALQPVVTLRGQGAVAADLRAVAGALAGRPDLADWRVEVGPSGRDGVTELLVYIAPAGDDSQAALGAYGDIVAVAGVVPAQIVVVPEAALRGREPDGAVTPRVAVRG